MTAGTGISVQPLVVTNMKLIGPKNNLSTSMRCAQRRIQTKPVTDIGKGVKLVRTEHSMRVAMPDIATLSTLPSAAAGNSPNATGDFSAATL